jgi:Starch-binding associating with outer membrane
MMITMYQKNTLTLLLLVVVIALFPSCDVSRFNENPNVSASGEVSLEKLLPVALYKAARIGTGQAAICTGIFAQYFTGIKGKELQYEHYNITETDTNPLWNDAYETMNLLNVLIKKANLARAPYYSGIAKIMMAYCLGTSTTFWGDMPYNDAFRMSAKINPAYDTQKSIYNSIQNLLTEGIGEVNSTPNQGTPKPSKDDVIYGGNMENWRRAAYALKARYYMHLASELDPRRADSALLCISYAFKPSLINADLSYKFTNGSEINPLYEYFNGTPAVEIDPIVLQRMAEDPRKAFYCSQTNGNYKLGKHFNNPQAPIELITYEETQLLEAEIQASKGIEHIEEAKTALQRAIRASINKLNLAPTSDAQAKITDYIDKYGTLTTSTAQNLELIMHQLYILHFGQPEGWMDIRRRSISLRIAPNVAPTTSGGGINEIPRRLPYPESERLYNAAFPKGVFGLTDRLWFDTVK